MKIHFLPCVSLFLFHCSLLCFFEKYIQLFPLLEELFSFFQVCIVILVLYLRFPLSPLVSPRFLL
uniref:Uncharacterized protein n=1 Tax=Siphoviridae sp. ctkJH11 TaxID=2825641 RepID=A0A8S5PSM8_9CAUD|nr:MAG TPA: hypothetical protein [Siphoviridae sp. ctkJH11]